MKIRKESPFQVQGLEKKVVLKKNKGGSYLSLETGEMLEVSPLSREINVDVDAVPFVKMFLATAKLLPLLSKPSLLLFTYIMVNLKRNEVTVNLSREYVVQHFQQLKGQGYYKAITQLEQLGVIAVKEGSVYFINPNIMFNGRRKKPTT